VSFDQNQGESPVLLVPVNSAGSAWGTRTSVNALRRVGLNSKNEVFKKTERNDLKCDS
jgi:hypothetical protein